MILLALYGFMQGFLGLNFHQSWNATESGHKRHRIRKKLELSYLGLPNTVFRPRVKFLLTLKHPAKLRIRKFPNLADQSEARKQHPRP
jgi:hypothetical protein